MTNCDVMLIDSDRLFCAALGALLSTTSFRISAEYTSLADATVAVRQGNHPDLILLNLLMPQLDGHGVLTELRADPERCRPTRGLIGMLAQADVAIVGGDKPTGKMLEDISRPSSTARA